MDAKMSIPDRIATCASMSSITRFFHKPGQASEDVALISLLSMGRVVGTALCSCMRANDGFWKCLENPYKKTHETALSDARPRAGPRGGGLPAPRGRAGPAGPGRAARAGPDSFILNPVVNPRPIGG